MIIGEYEFVIGECVGGPKELPDPLSNIPSLWTRSYFASAAGAVSRETIQRYIAAQKGV